jgi:drug/metabolite transporter (DMT)-like permease
MSTASKLSATGIMLALTSSLGWGLNWPITKYALEQWPPFSVRGLAGVAGAILLALYASARGISLRVPRDQWLALGVFSFLNVCLWMAVMGYALVYLPASEATVVAYTNPLWTALLAWPLLGERMTPKRVVALLMAFAGLVLLFGGTGISATMAKLPGILLALLGAIGFAFGTIFLKKYPIQLPGTTAATWQIGLGCLPVALAGIVFERPDVAALNAGGWAAMAYGAVGQFCIAYVAWFAALERLPASVAATVTMLAPVIGVTVSAAWLGEPLGAAKIAALALTIAGVVLATRS